MRRIAFLFALSAGAQELTLLPREPGAPEKLGGKVGVAIQGNYVRFSGVFPEPGGRVLARSIGKNPVWEIDATLSPPLEDRVEFRVSGRRDLTLAVNPLGAWRLEERGEAIANAEVLASARVVGNGWSVDAAILLDARETSLVVVAERIRSRRALAPEYRWVSAALTVVVPVQRGEHPRIEHTSLGNGEPPVEIGRVAPLPPVAADWEHPAWRAVPAFELPRHEPDPRPARYPTQVKWMHDGRTLALLVRAVEPEPVVARAGGRDSAVTGDDHLALYLATSGSAAVEIAVNSVGAIRDSLIRGPRIMRPHAWNGGIGVQTAIRHGEWIARVDVPLDEVASALGESGVPSRWRMAIGRLRAARPGEVEEWSAIPFVGSPSAFFAMSRYRAMHLTEAAPAAVLPPVERTKALTGLASMDSNVWTPLQRRFHGVRGMVQRQLRERARKAVLAERNAWESVNTREDWEKFRDQRVAALRESAALPSERVPLDARVSGRRTGRGYRIENVAYQSRDKYWVTANLYLPEPLRGRAPAILVVHSQHYPKTQGELHDLGEAWARAGAAVLVMERPGYGERAETNPWYRQAYASRFTFTKQLYLAGESYSGWVAWDIVRSVDYLHTRTEVDNEKIILLGAVAGGGEPSAIAAALDPRIAAVAPFNYDQGHVRVHGDSFGQIARQFSPWLVAASIAPRRFVRAFEFGWEGAEEPDYPELWVDGYERSKRVWGFYGAAENLAAAQAFGLIRLSMERASHCFSVGPEHRAALYPVFERWFGIPAPPAPDLAVLPDSELSVSPLRELARRQEFARRRPHEDLVSITPALAAKIERRALHEAARLGITRQPRGSLRDSLRAALGDIDPPASPAAQTFWTRNVAGVAVEAIAIETDPGISVPMLLLKPARPRPPIVVAVAQDGKDRFLKSRTAEIQALLDAGVAVCLADVRATGETSPSTDRGDGGAMHSLAQLEFDLGNSLMASRIKDLRGVLRYLRTRRDVDPRRISLWGESFAPPNPRVPLVDEVQLEGGPDIQHRADPVGAHLALLTALYEPGIRAVAARGGLTSYLTVLESPYTYVPMDAIVHGILKAGDISDIADALAPRPVLWEGAVGGRNISVNERRTDVARWLVKLQ